MLSGAHHEALLRQMLPDAHLAIAHLPAPTPEEPGARALSDYSAFAAFTAFANSGTIWKRSPTTP